MMMRNNNLAGYAGVGVRGAPPVRRVLFPSNVSRRTATRGYTGYKRRRVGKRSYRTGRLAGRYRSSQGRLNKELKNWDAIGTIAIPTAGGAIILPSSTITGAPLVGIAQGTTANQRTGRKILVKKVQYKATLNFVPGAGTVSSDLFKWWLVHDRQANGAYPSSIADIWTGTAVGQEMRNLDTTHRYKVLASGVERFESSAGVSGAYDSQVREIDIEHPCNMTVEMSSTAGAITEIKSNNILFCCGSVNNLITVTGSSRVRFYDQG
nr:MAG: capsid protein [Cressdnaviricota sp.]